MNKLRSRINGLKIRTKLLVLYIHCIISKDPELKEISRNIKFRRFGVFLYSFPEKYKQSDVDVFYDNDGYPYVLHNGEKLFLKKEWDVQRCQNYYNGQKIEQDQNSPHKYITCEERMLQSSDIVADIGAAEGFFALDAVKNVKKVYIFEPDDTWLIPLQKTFYYWKDKVEIVPKFVSNKDDSNHITLDTFFQGKEITYIKADIEGSELDMLSGSDYVLSHSVSKILLCTYHRDKDEHTLASIVAKYGFDISFNKGYMFFCYDNKSFKYPYIRRGVMFGSKPNESKIKIHNLLNISSIS